MGSQQAGRPKMFDYLQFVLAPQMVIGLSLGIAVVLVALGLTIIFGLLDVINMARLSKWSNALPTMCAFRRIPNLCWRAASLRRSASWKDHLVSFRNIMASAPSVTSSRSIA